MKLNRGNIVLCKVPMPSEKLRKFKLRPGLIVSKDLNNKRLDDVIIAICTSNISKHQQYIGSLGSLKSVLLLQLQEPFL